MSRTPQILEALRNLSKEYPGRYFTVREIAEAAHAYPQLARPALEAAYKRRDLLFAFTKPGGMKSYRMKK